MKAAAARRYLWDEDKGVFTSGTVHQVSWASQCWLILGDAVDKTTGGEILDHVTELEKAYRRQHPGEEKPNMAQMNFSKITLPEAIEFIKKDASEHSDRVEGMVTPYMYHVYVDALIHVGRKDKALAELKKYWGGMAEEGADTFWEMYNPENPGESPYGGTIVNSYCHAWSCASAYFLRKYFS